MDNFDKAPFGTRVFASSIDYAPSGRVDFIEALRPDLLEIVGHYDRDENGRAIVADKDGQEHHFDSHLVEVLGEDKPLSDLIKELRHALHENGFHTRNRSNVGATRREITRLGFAINQGYGIDGMRKALSSVEALDPDDLAVNACNAAWDGIGSWLA